MADDSGKKDDGEKGKRQDPQPILLSAAQAQNIPESILSHRRFDQKPKVYEGAPQDAAEEDLAALSDVTTTQRVSHLSRRYRRRMGDMDAAEQTNAWLVSFTDVMALMLTFYVLLFSMHEPTQKEWSEVAVALQKEFNKYYGASHYRGLQDSLSLEKTSFKNALELSYITPILEDFVAQNQSLDDVTVVARDKFVVLQVPLNHLFENNSNKLSEGGEKLVYDLSEMLSRIRNKIEIVAFAETDASPPEDGMKSAWELSMNRAAEVAAILENVGYNKNVTIRGHVYGGAESQAAGSVSGRPAQRIEIVVMNHGNDQDIVFAQ